MWLGAEAVILTRWAYEAVLALADAVARVTEALGVGAREFDREEADDCEAVVVELGRRHLGRSVAELGCDLGEV